MTLVRVGSRAMAPLEPPTQRSSCPRFLGSCPDVQSLSDSHRLIHSRSAAPSHCGLENAAHWECTCPVCRQLFCSTRALEHRWQEVAGGGGEGGKQLSLHWSCGHPLSAVQEAPLICPQDLPRTHLPPPGSRVPAPSVEWSTSCRMGASAVEWSLLLQQPRLRIHAPGLSSWSPGESV